MTDSEMGSECQLLEPVCLHVTVARNLSTSWYHGHADIELFGHLQEISVRLFFSFAVSDKPVCYFVYVCACVCVCLYMCDY